MPIRKSIQKKENAQNYIQIVKNFYSDLNAENLLYAKIIRSPFSKGIIKNISFEKIPDGYFLFTAEDFGEENSIETLDVQTEILASTYVFYKGQPIAIFAGPDNSALDELSKEIKIEIEKEPIQKQKEFPYAQRFIKNGKAKKSEDFSKLFSKKNYDVKGTWTSVLNAPSNHEPNGAFCTFEKNLLAIYTPTQWPKHLQENLCRVFSLNKDQFVIKKTLTSSPHTNTIWINTVIAILTSLVALKTHRSVKLVLSRLEHSEYMTKKSALTIKIHTSIKKDGFIEANQILIELDSGYHNPFAAEILDRLVVAANNFYSIRNFEIIAKAFESNTPPVSFNIESIDSQAFFAIENQIQKICKTTGFLPCEFRQKNFERKISKPFSFPTERLKEALSSIETQSDLNRRFVSYSLESKSRTFSKVKVSNIPMRGVGIATGFNGIGYFGTNIFALRQKMKATLESDGTLTIHANMPSNTSLEIWKNTAAEILELEPHQVKLNSNFIDTENFDAPENINSNLTVMNYLLKKCCLDIQSKRFRMPLPITSKKEITASQKKAWNKTKFSGTPFFSLSHATIFLEVEIDKWSFKVIIKKINVIINGGKIARPKVAENFIKLSIQHTLTELIQDEILEYNKISISFMKSENDPIQIDGLISKTLPAAFTSALSQALGREINSIPIKKEQIFKEILENEDFANIK